MTYSSRKSGSSWRRALFALALTSLGAMAFAQAASATHQVPIGASPARISMVPNYQACTGSSTPPINATHGPPLAVPACHSPVPVSGITKMGGSSIGFTRIVVCPAGTTAAFCLPAGGVMPLPDDRITASIVDVQCGPTASPNCAAPGNDYNPNTSGPDWYTTPGSGTAAPLPACFPTLSSSSDCAAGADLTITPQIPGGIAIPAGALTGTAIRISDHYNCGTGGPTCPADPTGPDFDATSIDIAFPIPMDCLPTVSTSTGSTCGANTTANALVPGAVVPGKKADVQIGQVQITDSGLDALRGTSDDKAFAVQGIVNP